MTHSIKINVDRAEHLDDVEHLGKNDPYVQFTLDFKEKDSFQRTSVKKNAGRNAEWNENLSIDAYDPERHHYLYVEILESDVGIDPPIGFAAIPLAQVLETPQRAFKGNFQLYTPKGKEKGTVSLTLAVVPAGQPAPHLSLQEIRGRTEIVSEHQRRVQTLKSNEKVNDVGLAAGIIGGLFAAKAAHNAFSNKSDAIKEQ
ncbi:hypothetical protein BGZ94_001928 [Podila epigama]|nr:hypothetical protein BGZ94_001928 [Podila epigama]